MDEKEFKNRTMHLGLAVIELTRSLKRDVATDTMARQIVRNATSVGANYRAACRGRSDAEQLLKMSVASIRTIRARMRGSEQLRVRCNPQSEIRNPK